jgi:hypothetical protein
MIIINELILFLIISCLHGTLQCSLQAENLELTDGFGLAVGISGNTIVVGAPYTTTKDFKEGAAYTFVKTASGWIQEAKILPHNPGMSDYFGYSVDIDENTIVIGANHEDSNSAEDPFNDDAPRSGAVYVYVRKGDTWILDAYLKASNAADGNEFGYSVSISDNIIVVGAPYKDVTGAVYVFERSGDEWNETAYIKAPHLATFGKSVSISGIRLMVYWLQEQRMYL